MKQLLALVPPTQASLIEWLVQPTELTVHASEEAFAALTELERTEVDAVLSSQDAGDMSGAEFRAILREEPKTRSTPFFLITDQPEPSSPPDYILSPELCTPQQVRQVMQELAVTVPATAPFVTEGAVLYGQMQEVSLAELLGWVAEMELSGHWLIQVGSKQGYLVMQRGDVVYAEYAGHLAHAAMLEVLDATELDPDSVFQFFRADLAAGAPQHITERTERLLMEVMVDIDHRRAERDGIPHE